MNDIINEYDELKQIFEDLKTEYNIEEDATFSDLDIADKLQKNEMMVIKYKEMEDEVQIHLVTIKDDRDPMSQLENFEQIRDVVQNAGVIFTWEFDNDNTIHARHIVTDNGWKISLDRGLDIFQHYEMNNSLDISNRLQEFRGCKAFEVTYIRQK